MSRFGRSVQERLQLPTKLKKYMLLSVRPLPISMEKKWQRILRSFMVEACKPSNAAELFAKPDVDGGLIGGAALKADSFMGIITAF